METIQFKDENLKKAILSEMKEQNLIALDAHDITEADALKVKELELFCEHIKLIEGLEKFKNLTNLYLSSNAISDLKPITGMTKLTWLALDHNSISDLTPLAGLSNLKMLWLHSNHISNLKPLKTLTNLTILNLYHNHISNIEPLTQLSNLTALFLDDDQIADILQRTKTEEEFQEVKNKLDKLPVTQAIPAVHER